MLHTVLVRVSRHKKGVETEEMKRYVAWYLEQHHRHQLGVRIVLIFDFTDAGITNMVCSYYVRTSLTWYVVTTYVHH